MPRLVVEKGSDKGRSIPIATKGTALVGRDSSAAMQLRDTMASRLHFKIEHREDGYWLVDLDSMNGTLVNAQAVREIRLQFGDLIKVGETLFSFLSDDAAAGSLTGQRIGGYRILERIGRGGMGTVYKAEQIDLQRFVALKVLSEENSADRDFIELFVHEARAAAKLNHPNVVQVYDVKHQGSLYFFSMEFVSGGSLQELLGKEKKVPVERALPMIYDAARGLEYAHSTGIIHRDIKPDNLMISESGSVKIADLGLARRVDEKVGPAEENSVIGTPHYIAPEQILGRPADFQSDIYSLGATLYRMLTGTTPYTAASVRELVNKKVREDPTPVHEAAPEVPRRLSDLVHRMMARDPGHRPPGMPDVVAAIRDLQRERAGASPEAEGLATSRLMVSNRRLLGAAVALLAVVVVGAGLGAVFLFQKTPAPDPVVAPGSAADLAQRMLENAKAFELNRMDPNQPESIREGMEGYEAVLEKFGDSEEGEVRRCVAKARDQKGKLEQRYRECVAAIELTSKWEEEDVENWTAMMQKFHAGKLDLSIVDRTIQAYRDFAHREDVRETEAASQAGRRETHIVAWKAGVEQWKREYEQVVAEIQPLLEGKKYNDAWGILSSFQQRVAAAVVKCEFSQDRYCAFLYDHEAGEQAKRVVTIAKSQYYKVEDEVKRLLQEKRAEAYEEALKVLDPVIRSSLDDLATLARLQRRAVEEEYARWRKDEEDRAEAQRRDELKKGREMFELASRDAYADVLKYRFKEALASLKSLEGKIPADHPYAPRLARRIEELERAVCLKDGLATNFKAGRLKKEFRWDKLSIDGTLIRFTEAGFDVQLRPQGTYEFRFTEFGPADFYRFVKEAWRPMDPDTTCCLVAVSMEFGLYEEARKEIETLKSLPPGKLSAAVKKFCELYEKLLRDGESHEFEEIEAAKRLGRMRTFLASGQLVAARAEIDLLRRKFGRTRALEDAAKEIEKAEREIERNSGEEQKRIRKSERQKAVEQSRTGTSNEAKKRQADIVVRLNRIEDLFERNWHLGEMYAAHGEWGKSTDRWLEAKRLGDRVTADREAAKAFLPLLGYVYVGLWRNGVVRNEPNLVKQIRMEAVKRFADERQQPLAWWSALSTVMVDWEERRMKGSAAVREILLKEHREDPDDPKMIWQLAEFSSETLQQKMDARGYYQFLLENHPEFQQVHSGEVHYRLAEILLEFKEVREAMRMYRELRSDYPAHPRVKEKEGENSVENRLKQCTELAGKMGYALDQD